jgi:Amidase
MPEPAAVSGPSTAGDGAAVSAPTTQDYSSAGQTNRYLERIAELNPLLGAVTTVSPDALREASARDQERPARRGPLHGIPVLVKDNIDVRGPPPRARPPWTTRWTGATRSWSPGCARRAR